MSKQIIIIGSGFAGLYSALGAKRLINQTNPSNPPQVTVISPAPTLDIRPRLYEANAASLTAPLGKLFKEAGIAHVAGLVTSIDHAGQSVTIENAGVVSTMTYDRLVLAMGSQLIRPTIPGLGAFAFDIDQVSTAAKLEAHLESLPSQPPSDARNTIVVAGAGFTGLEIATELPSRLRSIFTDGSKSRIILIDRNAELGHQIGSNPLPEIKKVLDDLAIEVLLSTTIDSVSATGLELSDGRTIPASTVIWTAGMVANSLTAQVPGDKDAMGRLIVGTDLRAPSSPNVFATGDTAHVLTDDEGHVALMSCQHALMLGRASGHNAAAGLLGLPLYSYSQPSYGTCLSLGEGRAVVTGGWDRQVIFTGAQAKAVKEFINTKLIYPPTNSEEAFVVADPAYQIPPLQPPQPAAV
ncbi:hypothetical protein VHEMI01074 [[Torrubiella] hemipterigena]|uniref:FAD/NAD(P)-binding domain-containing protein n=1 Tax=[Torrubiella] hemipterigena TaxID=1531966 RepID=A0A0A1T3R2_9HYPO|nr:hypothetical protein VHEMI01074 [[Torrubiella] hemipterigena]